MQSANLASQEAKAKSDLFPLLQRGQRVEVENVWPLNITCRTSPIEFSPLNIVKVLLEVS